MYKSFFATMNLLCSLLLAASFLSCGKSVYDEYEQKQPETVIDTPKDSPDNEAEDDMEEPTNPEQTTTPEQPGDSEQPADSTSPDTSDPSDTGSAEIPDIGDIDPDDPNYEEGFDESGGGVKPVDDGSSQQDNPVDGIRTGDVLTVSELLEHLPQRGVYVKGYIVGTCKRHKNYAKLEADFSDYTALLVADAPSEKNLDKMIAIKVSKGTTFRNRLDAISAQELYGHQVKVFGYITSYLSMNAMDDLTDFSLSW